MTELIVLIVLLIAVVAVVALTYNGLIAMIEAIKNNHKQIDIQLDRRYKVFESLVEVVKKYMDYEKSTLKEVIGLRTQAQSAKAAGDDAGRVASENKISQILGGLNLVFEQYPDLKANQNALQLQEEIVNTENKLTFAKQALNDSIERYFAKKKSFPTLLVVSMFKQQLDMDFQYWQLPEGQVEAKEAYQVKL